MTKAPIPGQIETDHWTMFSNPSGDVDRIACVATVHPIGDRRVVRCAQALADAGYGIHFVWLGGEVGETRYTPSLAETRIASARSFSNRIRKTINVARAAWSTDADLWHIHDLYMLPFALAWRWLKRRPVIYDVHEFYPEYYAERMPLPKRCRQIARLFVWRTERWFASRLGAVNVVNPALADRFREAGIKACVTPNFPALRMFPTSGRKLTPELLRRVVHTGTLTREYGSEVILETAHLLAASAPEVQLIVIRRFPSDADEAAFQELLDRKGHPPNLTLLNSMPLRDMGALLSECGIGLSAIQAGGQNDLAVQTKLYEYVGLGLAIVASDLTASRRFIEEHGRGEFATPNAAEQFAEGIYKLIEEADKVCAEVNEAAARAAESISWEISCAPELQRLVQEIDVLRSRPTRQFTQ